MGDNAATSSLTPVKDPWGWWWQQSPHQSHCGMGGQMLPQRHLDMGSTLQGLAVAAWHWAARQVPASPQAERRCLPGQWHPALKPGRAELAVVRNIGSALQPSCKRGEPRRESWESSRDTETASNESSLKALAAHNTLSPSATLGPQCHLWDFTPWHRTQKSPNCRARESYELFMVTGGIRNTGDPLLLQTEP